ncbi:hypothetical protein AB205_0077270 [Aquarana catesbeiana]|uniref:[2Fe-2S]-binding domain-containing protein n=1 Tax=Aquarana catesbeiana TaxID=8400 RepID=A0A2G9SEC3_AQUCT|nr:hypothetical protein AB205_0077270 [Aquarana catesbeiana]
MGKIGDQRKNYTSVFNSQSSTTMDRFLHRPASTASNGGDTTQDSREQSEPMTGNSNKSGSPNSPDLKGSYASALQSLVIEKNERIAKSHGSQCGFCTPGIVMSMYALLRNTPQPSMEEIEDAFQGNLCRCTGYRPILQGFKTFAKDSCCGKKMTNGCCMDKKEENETKISSALFDPSEFRPLDPTQELIFPPELLLLKNSPRRQLCFKGEDVMWLQPSSLDELLNLKARYPEAKLVVGNTEVGES